MARIMRCMSIGVSALVMNTGVYPVRQKLGGSGIGHATAANGAAFCARMQAASVLHKHAHK